MIKTYQVVETSTLQELVDQVNYRITLGWKPLGGVAVYASGFWQAMIYNLVEG